MNTNDPTPEISLNEESTQRKANRLRSWFQRVKEIPKASMAAVLTALAAVTVPIWQVYFVQRSDIAVEISTIKKNDIGEITVDLQEEGLGDLAEFIPDQLKYIHTNDGRREEKISFNFTIAELRDILNRAQLFHQDVPQRLQKLKSTIEDIEVLLGIGSDEILFTSTATDNDEFAIDISDGRKHAQFERFKNLSIRQYRRWELPNYLDPFLVEFYSKEILEYTVAGATPDQEEIDQVVGTLGSLLKDLKAAQIKLEEQNDDPVDLRKMGQIIDEIFQRILERNVEFQAIASVSNSGRVSTSIKRHALLRVYIGVGNYVDLFLTMDNFGENAEIAPNATKVVTFSTQEISTYPEEDQKLINQYWGQSVRSVMFVLDTNENIYASNPIAFSEGLNQKLVYDSLAKEAAKPQYYETNKGKNEK